MDRSERRIRDAAGSSGGSRRLSQTAAAGALTLPLLLASRHVQAQGPRVTLSIRWSSDSSWDGSYLAKPHRFRVHEELDGRLVFELPDSTLFPRPRTDPSTSSDRSLKAVQVNDGGTSTGATLVDARGTTAYTLDVAKEGGDCAVTEQPDTTGVIRAPFVGHEEGRADWLARAPGMALILVRSGEPVAFAFAPRSMHVESSHRLLCPQPETVRRSGTYRVTVRFGDLLGRRGGAPSSAGEGQWIFETTRTALGGYLVRGSYDVVVRQHHAMPGDPSSAIGQLTVTKRVTLTWEPGGGSPGMPSDADRGSPRRGDGLVAGGRGVDAVSGPVAGRRAP